MNVTLVKRIMININKRFICEFETLYDITTSTSIVSKVIKKQLNQKKLKLKPVDNAKTILQKINRINSYISKHDIIKLIVILKLTQNKHINIIVESKVEVEYLKYKLKKIKEHKEIYCYNQRRIELNKIRFFFGK